MWRCPTKRTPEYPLCFSVRGYRYCDLLLAPAEREAWRCRLGLRPDTPTREDGRVRDPTDTLESAAGGNAESGPAAHPRDASPSPSQACHTVTDHATQTLKIAERNNWLLDIALDHLTLSRAGLYESLLSGSAISPSASPLSAPSSEIEAAVSGLRRAGHSTYLPRGLLTRAWQRSLLGRKTGQDSAQSDLDEAWEIASRGPMPLFMADIHLHRARLFAPLPASPQGGEEQGEYPWDSVEHDLKEARRLIEKHGYGRRMEELEDAEGVLLLEK